jgi:hypothetical protein
MKIFLPRTLVHTSFIPQNFKQALPKPLCDFHLWSKKPCIRFVHVVKHPTNEEKHAELIAYAEKRLMIS